MADLFGEGNTAKAGSYGAADIEVLEGLEPVRKRPGMYIGGTDERALHHLVGEILDNSMDEAVAGHANRIELAMNADGSITVTDNGRGIPVDNHPKFPKKSALEVIFTTLHSGGKFSGKSYETSGGLHGVGSSVVNALSEWMTVEVFRDKTHYKQSFARGLPTSKLEKLGSVNNKRGTSVTFKADHEIFGTKLKFKPSWLYQMARSKAYLYRGVEIRWSCDPSLLKDASIPGTDTLHFPNGLLDFLQASLQNRPVITDKYFHGQLNLPEKAGRVEFAIAWPEDGDPISHSYCNTIPTPLGGTHEQGLRTALTRGIKSYGSLVNNKKTDQITSDDVMNGAAVLLSVFIRDPQFQGQTKEKLVSNEAAKWVDSAIKDYFDHWLTADPAASKMLLESIIEKADERMRRKSDKEMARKTATRKLRLPGKLSDCSRTDAEDTELFLVEGDSAGGSAKQARNRETQAVLPLRGKILNVYSATADKVRANQEVQDLILALGCGAGKDFDVSKLRYERVIIMTDADVDGAHIASLLVTFFYTQMRELIEKGHLYLAQPPLYRITSGNLSEYAQDDAHKDELMKTTFKDKKKVDISRFKGLGEMPAVLLKETTMAASSRTLLRVTIPDAMASLGITEEMAQNDKSAQGNPEVDDLVDRLMGKNADARFQFIQENAEFVQDIDI
ncbi:MAG: DNA topoisomerase IV subunit B [Micavibrio aeruginosavorus]|uniref:DNA topoisomerase (ATP-hydrolyzing) n=1 Tax=Micavibrio aeruginosavorus TaxID=349221 RepID=A0A2W5N126_9BACT|nr:MAG: DNA topoisomerase IV subunit B [Micavibrio aeruginosavorus]